MRANDFPIIDGRPVTEAHARICADRGHATHTVDGVVSGICPRCGDVTTLEADFLLGQFTTHNPINELGDVVCLTFPNGVTVSINAAGNVSIADTMTNATLFDGSVMTLVGRSPLEWNVTL